MLIYAIMPLKNDADIIIETLDNTLKWADKIFVVDNNSRDSTVRKVKEYKSEKVELVSIHLAEFQYGIRMIPFHVANNRVGLDKPDWWCIADSDEMYVDNPKEFLRKVPKYCGRVCTSSIEFFSLKKEYRDLMSPESYEMWWANPWSESRFFRHTDKLKWSNYLCAMPENLRAVHKIPIRIYHFPLRSIEQIEERIATRLKVKSETKINWEHATKYISAEQLLENYGGSESRSTAEPVVFYRRPPSNFLNTKMLKFKRAIKILLYYFNVY